MADDIGEFCRQLITHPSPYEHLSVGSFFELPIMYFLENITDLDNMIINKNNYLPPVDEDLEEQMIQTKNTSKLPTGEQESPVVEIDTSLSPYAGFGTVKKALRIGEERSHVGFTQLIYVNKNRPFRSTDMHHSYSEVSRKRTLISKSGLSKMFLKPQKGVDPDQKSDGTEKQCRSNQLLSLPNLFETATSLFAPSLSSAEDLTMDWVDCVQCKFWPNDAKEWISRERQHGWPPSNIIDTIINDGCFLVSKSHQNQPDAEEFRYSFSKAELILINSWNSVQKHIYHIMRLVKKDVVKNCGTKDDCPLKTYHVKTLMLWACEEKPPQFWEIESLAASLKTLLCTMIEWLIEKDCRNYFISSYNMWDYLTQGTNQERSHLNQERNNITPIESNYEVLYHSEHHEPNLKIKPASDIVKSIRDCEEDVRSIIWAIENIQMYIDKTVRLFKTLSDREDSEMQVLVPNKLFFIIQLRFYYAQVLNPTLSGSQRYMVGNAFEKSDFVRSKFEGLYNILVKHVEYLSKNQERNNITTIESNHEVLYRSEHHERNLQIKLADDIVKSIRELRDVSFEGTTEITISPCDDGHKFIKRILDTSIGHKRQHDIDVRQTSREDIMIWRLEPFMQPLIQYLNDDCSVHPFLILSFAYEANFHYTGFADCPDFEDHCRLALDLCKEGLELCTKLSKEDTFWISAAPEVLPVLVTKRWLNIFDRHIIAALKLYLCTSDELETKDFVVRFSVQPFLKYVGLQCCRIIGNSLDKETVLNTFAYEPDPNPTTGILWSALDGRKA